jgi:lipopolysaccharide transport system permease protein
LFLLNSHYRDLVLYKAMAGLRSEAARNYLSFLWWVLEPLLSMLVFYIVFGLLIQRGTEDFVPFLLIGLVSWHWFANTIKHSMTSIYGNGRLMNHVDLPKVIFPSVVIVMDLVKFSFVLLMLLLFLWLYGFDIGLPYLALPLVLGTQFLLIIGLSYLAAAIIPFIPDLRFLVDTLLHLAFFLSGIFYAGASIPEQYRFYFYLNPMANLIEAYRDIFMDNAWPDWTPLLVITLFSITVVYAGQRLIRRFEYLYPRMVMV